MSDNDEESSLDDIENDLNNWYPRDMLRRTNWLYRVDALRPHDMREMDILWELCEICKDYATQFIIWAYSLRSIISASTDPIFSEKMERIVTTIMVMIQMFWSEGYCCFLDFLTIAYYPVTNRITGEVHGHRFPDITRNKISLLGNNDARELTGLSTMQLQKLFDHLRIPDIFRTERRYSFTSEESFLHYMVYNRLGDSKLKMSQNYFGGDPRRFTYSIRMMTNHIYTTFYHKISGDSMRMWIPYINDFRHAIWSKLTSGVLIEYLPGQNQQNNNDDRVFHLTIPFESFRIFGFLDDTGFRTTSPGNAARRRVGFFYDVQRAFYSGYFSHHGLKVQAVSLPNGMFGSVFIGSIRVSDSGLLNMSGLDTYLSSLFREFNMNIELAYNQFPALYGDGVFPQLSTIVARYSNATGDDSRLNIRMASVRKSIEHLFALLDQTFGLVSSFRRFQILHNGTEVSRILMYSFFPLNCYTCMNESPNNFICRPPTLEEYIPIEEYIKPAPIVDDSILGDVYHYVS